MTFSVIIPTAGRPQLLAQLIGALQAQVFEQPFEILIVDDRPGEDLRHLTFRGTSYKNGLCESRLLRGSGRGPALARNLGASEAKGTYLLFLDDDALVDALYLGRVLKELESRPGCAVCGMQIAIEGSNSFALAAEWLSCVFIEGEALAPPHSKFAATNGLALRRADFQRSGGFDPAFPLAASEDREFSVRWLAKGFHIILLKEASVEHHFPGTFRALMKQQWRYGRGAFHLQSRVPPKLGSRIRRPHFYLRMVTEAPRRYGLRRGVWIGMLSWISQGAIMAGYLRERVRPASSKGPAIGRAKQAGAE